MTAFSLLLHKNFSLHQQVIDLQVMEITALYFKTNFFLGDDHKKPWKLSSLHKDVFDK